MITVRTVDTSSNIISIGYDSDTLELRVMFGNGGVYSYEGVPLDAYERLLKAQSKGQHLHKHIKQGYPGRKCEEQFS